MHYPKFALNLLFLCWASCPEEKTKILLLGTFFWLFCFLLPNIFKMIEIKTSEHAECDFLDQSAILSCMKLLLWREYTIGIEKKVKTFFRLKFEIFFDLRPRFNSFHPKFLHLLWIPRLYLELHCLCLILNK